MPNITQLFNLQNYFHFETGFAPLLVSLTALVLGGLIYKTDARSAFNRAIFYLCLSVGLWLGASSLSLSTMFENLAFFWVKISWAGMIFFAAGIYHFSVTYTGKYYIQNNFLKLIYVQAALLSALLWHSNFFDNFVWTRMGYYPQAGDMTPMAALFIIECFLITMINFVRHHMIEDNANLRKETRYFMLLILCAQLSYVDMLRSYSFNILPSGYFILLMFVLGLCSLKFIHDARYTAQMMADWEARVRIKSNEASKVMEELKATQVKLLETGRVSALASLSAGILHQISQPLTAIHGFARFMKKEMNPEDDFYRPVCLIDEQSTYLKNMLEDLMDIVRHREIKKEFIQVNDAIHKSTNLLSDELRIRRINWDCQLGEKLPPLFADSIHLQQIFMNILTNSIQALSTLPHGEYRYIKIVSEYNEEDNRINVSFRDNGPGICSEEREKIFEPFFSTKAEGSGIGLFLCHDLIAEHGGSIALIKEENTGAHFVVSFPVTNSHQK